MSDQLLTPASSAMLRVLLLLVALAAVLAVSWAAPEPAPLDENVLASYVVGDNVAHGFATADNVAHVYAAENVAHGYGLA